jgi:polar amino acid transport system substrate-binding protein
MLHRNHIIALVIAIFAVSAWFFMRRNESVRIVNDNLLVVGTTANYPPFEFIQDGNVVGYDIDIAREVARRMGKELDLQDMAFDALVPATQLGHMHIIAAALTPTPERAQRVAFSNPYFSGDALAIIIPESEKETIKSTADLKDKRVVVNQGYYADIYISAIPSITTITRLDTMSDAFLALKAGHADAFVTSAKPAQKFFEKQGQTGLIMIPVTDAQAQESYALAISQKHPDLVPLVNKALQEMHQDGTIAKLKKKWKLS